MEKEVLAKGSNQEKTMYCSDAIVIQAKDYSGQLWSRQYGRIYFIASQIKTKDLSRRNSLKNVIPGTLARVWAFKQDFDSESCERFEPDSQWKATQVELTGVLSPETMEGIGTVTRTDKGHGFIDSETFDYRLFAPGFAASNNMTEEHERRQMSDLEATRVHFLAIPNPKPIYSNRFVVSVHPLTDRCSQTIRSSPIHWLQPSNRDGVEKVYEKLKLSQSSDEGLPCEIEDTC